MYIESVKRAVDIVGTQEKLAEKISLTQSAVSNWIRGKRIPTGQNARAIEIATGGLVTRQELRPDIFN